MQPVQGIRISARSALTAVSYTHLDVYKRQAVTSGIKEIKTVMQEAEENRRMGLRTVLFADEIHRFNKAQQDAFLPFVEKGSVILVGATTENPSFEINSALLSRCKVFVMKALGEEDLLQMLHNAIASPKGFGKTELHIHKGQLEAVARFEMCIRDRNGICGHFMLVRIGS